MQTVAVPTEVVRARPQHQARGALEMGLGLVICLLVLAHSRVGYAAPVASCGDGLIQGVEECDDSNTSVGDGCDAGCNVETCFECTGQPSVCTPASNTTSCDDGNLCTDDLCNGSGQCVGTNNAAPCDDLLFCNGTDTCGGGACSVHNGDPCPGTQCNTCQEGSDACFDPAGTTCSDGNPASVNDACDGGGGCVGQLSSLANYAILRWGGSQVIKSRIGKDAKVVNGHVCVDVISLRRGGRIGSDPAAISDAIGLRTNRTSLRFARSTNVAQDLITGGGAIRGQSRVTFGGRIDTTLPTAEITECNTASADAAVAHGFFSNPALPADIVSSSIVGGAQTIPASGTLGPGRVVVDVTDIRLRTSGTLTIVGGPMTKSVIIRVASKMHLGRNAQVILQGLTPEQVLFVVEGPFVSRRNAVMRGSILGNDAVTIGIRAMLEGQLLTSRLAFLRIGAMIIWRPFVDWVTHIPGPTATPTQSPTNTAPTLTPTETWTPDPTASETPTATETFTAGPTASPTDTVPTETATPTATATSSASATATGPLLPDLVEISITDPPPTIQVGQFFSASDTVQNQGNATAGASQIRYFLSFDTVKDNNDFRLNGVRNVPILLPGDTSTGTISVGVHNDISPGTYFMLVCADWNLLIPESNENNNCLASTSMVTVLP